MLSRNSFFLICIPLSCKTFNHWSSSSPHGRAVWCADFPVVDWRGVGSIESDGQLRTSLYDKRDDFNFHITNFPFLSSNIPSSPAYGVFISQLIWYARACSSYECFILRAARLSSKLLGQGYVMKRLKSSLRKFYGRYGDLIKHYAVSLSQMLDGILGHDHIQWHPQLIRYYTSLRPYYRTWLYYRFWPYYQILEVSIEHCNGCG